MAINIDENQFDFKYTRSAGPGGQNVNKLNTRVTLFFDVKNCPQLSGSQKKRLLNKLSGRIDKNGVMRVSSQRHRTQKANQNAATQRFYELIQNALKTKPLRKKTKPPRKAKEKRLAEKKKRSQIKNLRKPPTANN